MTGARDSRIRVVIVDDTADVRALLRYTLSLDGRFEVVGEAADGAEAIAIVELEMPDAVVLDLVMPTKGGLEVLPELRQRVPSAKIVVLSGLNAPHVADEALASGAVAFLDKGATFNQLTTVLADVCSAPVPGEGLESAPRGPLDVHIRSTRGVTDGRLVDGSSDQDSDRSLREQEVVMRQARWIGALFALLEFSLYRPVVGMKVPYALVPIGLAIASVLVLVNLVSLWAVAYRGERFLARLGVAELVVDVAIVLTVVAVFSFDPTSALWALIILPVLEGAVRRQMSGALLAWAGAASGYVARELWAAHHYGDRLHRFGIDSVIYRMGIVLLVAVTTGHLARNFMDQARRHQRARQESEHRARLLALVAAASRSMNALDAEQLLDTVVDAALALGFDGVELCTFDEGAGRWIGARRRGMPDRVGREQQPIDVGIAGAVRSRRETLLVDDYEAWNEGLPESRSAGFHSTLGTPIWTGTELAAALVVGRTTTSPVLPHEIECIELLAAQAGVGLSNVRLVEQMRHLALHDSLTGLPNQMLFEDRVAQSLTQTSRDETTVAVLFLDLDRFKKVNDTLGHESGNELLKQVAGRLLGAVRRGDTVARMGGDEFTLLLPMMSDVESVELVASKIVGAFSSPFSVSGQQLYMSASIGIAVHPTDGCSYETLLKHADIAMYRAKAKGGNGYELYAGAAADATYPRLALEVDLHNAVVDGDIDVAYQPLVDLRSDIVVGVEALARWNHPRLGSVRPDEFIPLAEETGLIIALDTWVLRQACAQLQRWRRAGLEPVRLAVNISGRHLQDTQMARTVLQVLHESGVDPHLLELEITESVAVAEGDDIKAALDSLRRVGVRIAIDDFGTGYSMLGRLRQLPLDTLKIDRSFVNEIGEHADSPIVSSTIAMAHSLGLEVVAEGVETAAQLAFLRAHGCELAQGFLLGRPVAGDELESVLRQVPASA